MKVYNIGDKVFAKIKGYPPWPAKIEGDTGKKKYNVTFYGTNEVGVIKVEDISYYLENKNNFIHKYLKRVGYSSAVKEIEKAIEEDGGDGSENAVANDNNVNASNNSSITEKRGVKRKSTSAIEETSAKKQGVKARRRSIVLDIKENTEEVLPEDLITKKAKRKSIKPNNDVAKDVSDDPVTKKPRRKSVISENETLESKVVKNETQAVQEPTQKENEKLGTNVVDKNRKDVEENQAVDETTKQASQIVEDRNVKEKIKDVAQSIDDTDKESEMSSIKSNIITEQMLNNNVLYAEHVKKQEKLYKDKPVEIRGDSKDHIFAIKLPSGVICGLKIHKEWPLNHNNEYERTLYDEKVATSLLQIKNQINAGNIKLNQIDSFELIPDLHLSSDELKEIAYTKDIESKKKRLDRLKTEADLVTWDSNIKMSLGLDKALLDDALACLNDFNAIEKSLDALMFKKHPHILETIRRLRKYVGNVKEWKMDDKELNTFSRKAEKIRTEAEKIYNKLKSIINIHVEKPTFWESFLEVVSEFRVQCKDLSDLDTLVLCAEPNSRQAFLDKLDEITESEVEN